MDWGTPSGRDSVPSYILPDDPPDIKPDVQTPALLSQISGSDDPTSSSPALRDPLDVSSFVKVDVKVEDEGDNIASSSASRTTDPGNPTCDALEAQSGSSAAGDTEERARQLDNVTNDRHDPSISTSDAVPAPSGSSTTGDTWEHIRQLDNVTNGRTDPGNPTCDAVDAQSGSSAAGDTGGGVRQLDNVTNGRDDPGNPTCDAVEAQSGSSAAGDTGEGVRQLDNVTNGHHGKDGKPYKTTKAINMRQARALCGYPGCDYDGLRQHLARHTDRLHPGLPIRERRPADGTVMILPRKRRRQGKDGKPYKTTKAINMRQARTLCGYPGCDYDGLRQHLARHTDRLHPGLPIRERRPADGTVMILPRKRRRQDAQEVSTQGQLESVGVLPANIVAMLSSARSINTLLKASGQQLYYAPDHNVVICDVCRPGFDPSQADHAAHRMNGVFHYDLSVGACFSSKLPRPFLNLKSAIKAHIAGAFHLDMQDARRREAAEHAMRAEDDVIADDVISSRVLRTAYHVLRESLPRQQFEELVVLQQMNGLDMGTLCHCASQMVRFRDAFGDVVLDAVARHVRKAPCVSWVADRVNVNGRTLNITGIITLVPDAPPDELIQSLIVGVPVVRDRDAASLASQWVEMAARIGLTDVRQLAAVCTGSEYHRGGVTAKFLAKLAARRQNDAASAEPTCVPCLWEDEPLVSPADAGVRAGCSWVKETLDDVTRITRKFMAGKHHGALACGSQLWSRTTSSSQAVEVLDNFLASMPVCAAAVQERIDSLPTSSRLIGMLYCDLRRLTGGDPVFLVRVAALLDLYRVLGRAIGRLPSLQLPWERQTHYCHLVQELGVMTASVQCGRVPSRWVGREAVRKALEEAVTAEMAASWPTLAKHTSLIDANLVSEISSLSRALLKHCARDENGATHARAAADSQDATLLDAMDDIRAAADLQALRRLPLATALLNMHVVTESLVTRRLIPDGVPKSCLTLAHEVLQAAGEGLSNQELFRQLWRAAGTRPGLQPFVDLVARLWLVYPSVGVVDSTAGVAREVFDTHRSLQHENAAKELMVRWNGPDICSADGLISQVQTKYKFKFARSGDGVAAASDGAVIRRRKAKRCPRLSLYTGE